MSNALSWGKIAAGLIATAAAIVGWSVVILQGTWLDDLERKLAEARQENAVATSARPQSSKSAPMVQEQPPALEIQRDEAMGRFEQLQTELDAKTAELASVRSKIDHSVAQLEQLEAAVHSQRQLLEGSARNYRTTKRARIRAGPSTETEEVAVVPQGRTIQVFEIVEDGTWYRVGGMGYIFHQLLEPAAEE